MAQARQVGISRKVLRSPRFRRVFHGVYIWAELSVDLPRRCQAATLLFRTSAVFSHTTVALLLRLPVEDDLRVHLTVPLRSDGPVVAGIAVHRRVLDQSEVATFRAQFTGPGADYGEARVEPARTEGIPPFRQPTPLWWITRAPRTFTDLASLMNDSRLVDLVIAGDAMVRKELVTRPELLQAVSRFRTTGARLAHRAAELVRERVDSPMETKLRLLLVLAGLPRPEVNLPVRGPAGDILAVVDLMYPDQKILLEYDGDIHRTEKHKWRRDRSIRRTMDDLGWDVHAFDGGDLACTPDQTISRIHAALRARGHPDVPRRPGHQWRAYFRIERPWYIDEED